MTKLHSELVRKIGETGDLIPGGTFRLRFNATDQPFIKPHFSALLDLGKQEPTKIHANEAIEVDFTIAQVDGDQITGVYTEAPANTDDLLIEQHIDYDAEVPDPVKEASPVLPDTLNEAALTTATKLADNSYPEPGHVKISGGKTAGQFVEAGMITFEVDKWKGEQHKERTSWIVYSGHSSDAPVLYYQFENNINEKSDVNKKGFTREIDFSKLPLGKYRVEAIGKWGLWHADHKKNRFGIAIDPKKKRTEYAYTDIESTADRLTEIMSGDDKLVAPDEQVTFSTSSLFNDVNSLAGMTWTVSNAQGETMQNQTTGVQTSSISLKFPTPGGNTVQEYTLKATSGSGLTTERKIQVNFLKRKGVAELIDDTIPTDKRSRTGASAIMISAGPFSGKSVGLRPVTFKVSNPNKDAKFSWIVYQGKDAKYPIDVQFDHGRELTVDFGLYPEGEYCVEAFGRVSQWHAENGKDRFGDAVKSTKGPFAKMQVTSKQNVLENVNSKNLIRGEKSKQQETNWGVPVVFDADLLFDFEEDIAQLTWEITDKENIPVYEDQTLAAKGNAHPTFNFDQPTADAEYTLKLTLNGVSKTQKFIVVAQAYVKNIQLTGDADKFVYSEQRTLKFSVKGYTQQQANTSDKTKVKWVRVFFPDLHYDDYKSEQLVYNYEGGIIISAKFGTHTTTNVKMFTDQGENLDVPAGIPETTAANSSYRKGLYFVEAYMNKPDGRKGAMDVYELARNEPKTIVQLKTNDAGKLTELSGQGYARSWQGMYDFKVKSWEFGAPLGEETNVKWKLFESDGTTPVITSNLSRDDGSVLIYMMMNDLPDGESKDYILNAYTGEMDRGAQMNVRIAKPKIIEAFFTDSTGRKITQCSRHDTVYFYMKTVGMELESVHASMWEWDSLYDDFFTGTTTTVNEKGVVFAPMDLSTIDYEKNFESGTNQVYPTLGIEYKSALKPNNHSWDSGVRNHYYIEVTNALDIIEEVKSVDFGFFDVNWQPLKTAVKVGDKVKVRVRVTNVGDSNLQIYIYDFLTDKEMTLAESNTIHKATKEGYTEMEFIVPEGWYTGDGSTARYFYPIAGTSGHFIWLKPDWEFANLGKMLKVAKDPTALTVVSDGTQYGDVTVQTAPTVDTNSKALTSIDLAWGVKVDQMFAIKLLEVCSRIECQPNDLMAVMAVETGRTFWSHRLYGVPESTHPTQANITESDVSGKAVGLIQFTITAVDELNRITGADSYTKLDIAKMTQVEQLELVARTIVQSKKNRGIAGPIDIDTLYLLVFKPGAYSPDNTDATVLYETGSEEYTLNAGVDSDGDGKITKGELVAKAKTLLNEGLQTPNRKTFDLTAPVTQEHIYKVDISTHTFQKSNDPGAASSNYVYYIYDGTNLLGYHVLNKYKSELLSFPFNGPNWNRFGTRDAGGDNYASEKSAAAAFGFFYSLPGEAYTESLFFNDISAFDERDIGHSTHKTGCDFDIRYPGVAASAGEKLWTASRDAYGSEDAFVADLEKILKVADEWGFKNNYAYKTGIQYTKGTATDVHQNHFHIGYKE